MNNVGSLITTCRINLHIIALLIGASTGLSPFETVTGINYQAQAPS